MSGQDGWVKVAVEVAPGHLDAASGLLWDLGASGVEIQDETTMDHVEGAPRAVAYFGAEAVESLRLRVASAVPIAWDARVTVERLKGPFDTVYLDILSPDSGKALYLGLLEALYPKLSPSAWVLAHDTTLGCYSEQLAGYLRVVRNPRRFRQSISFDIDALGLELSIR